MTDETKNDGGPAFPSEGEGHGNPQYHSPGMTLRDWFAAHALISIGTWCPTSGGPHGVAYSLDSEYARKERSRWAYAQADAMLSERSK